MPVMFLIFFVLSLAEIALLIEVGSMIGAIPTILCVVGTAMLGSYLVRKQGLQTMQTIQLKAQRGEAPSTELAEGFLIMFAAALLITPGFVTDAMGFICLTPGLRSILAQRLMQRLGPRIINAGNAGGAGHSQQDPFAQFRQRQQQQDDDSIIDGDFIREEPRKPLD